MTATAAAFVPRYYSEMVKETPGSYDDCALCSSLVLWEMVTLREGVTRDDGRWMDTIRLRELRDEAGLKPDGPLRFNDLAQYLAFLCDKVGISPAFKLDYYTGHPGGTLRLTWDQYRQKVRDGHVSILLGNPIGVKDPTSPLRSNTANDDFGHAIAVFSGTTTGARVFDPLTRHPDTWPGVRVSWDDLRQFTTARKNGAQQYGSSTVVACAVAETGSYTAEARVRRELTVRLAKANLQVAAQKAQTSLATDERDQARRDLAVATATIVAQGKRIAELEATDCSGAEDEAARLRDVLDRVRALVTL